MLDDATRPTIYIKIRFGDREGESRKKDFIQVDCYGKKQILLLLKIGFNA